MVSPSAIIAGEHALNFEDDYWVVAPVTVAEKICQSGYRARVRHVPRYVYYLLSAFTPQSDLALPDLQGYSYRNLIFSLELCLCMYGDVTTTYLEMFQWSLKHVLQVPLKYIDTIDGSERACKHSFDHNFGRI